MGSVAYAAREPCGSCGSRACAIQSPGRCRHGDGMYSVRPEPVDMATVDPCPACSSGACMAQSPGHCRHAGGKPRPAPGAVVRREDGVVQDVTVVGGRSAPAFRPTAARGGRGRK